MRWQKRNLALSMFPERKPGYRAYINGYITVEFAQPEGRGRIKVTCVDSGESVSNWFYTITPYSIYVGDAPGVYQIDITTSQNSYEGTLIL